MAKVDIKKAFRIIPIHPSDYHLFVVQWRGKFYVDRTLQMGCSSSCQIFEAFSSAIEWIARVKLGIQLVHYLNDFLIIALGKEQGNDGLAQFIEMCGDMAIPLAPEKTVRSTTKITFLGVELDSVHEIARLPQEKLCSCRQEMEDLISTSKATLGNYSQL